MKNDPVHLVLTFAKIKKTIKGCEKSIGHFVVRKKLSFIKKINIYKGESQCKSICRNCLKNKLTDNELKNSQKFVYSFNLFFLKFLKETSFEITKNPCKNNLINSGFAYFPATKKEDGAVGGTGTQLFMKTCLLNLHPRMTS